MQRLRLQVLALATYIYSVACGLFSRLVRGVLSHVLAVLTANLFAWDAILVAI